MGNYIALNDTSEQLTMRKIAYYANNQSTNAHTDIYSNDNARKNLERKPALANPMHALGCIRIPAQKHIRLHTTNAPMVRNNTIPLRALTSNLDPSLQTYVCPFLMCRMRYSFYVNSRNERKWFPYNARTGTKVTKTGHFGEFCIWGF